MTLNRILRVLEEDRVLVKALNVDELIEIPGKVCTDNRKVSSGDVFVCIKGQRFDGHDFVAQALDHGAVLIISEILLDSRHPLLVVNNSRRAAALLAKLFYANPSSRFRLIGITGTNGKTTVASLLYQSTKELGCKSGLIGTLGYWIEDEHLPTLNTTPDIIDLNEILSEMANKGVEYVFMEVSSHALALDRVYGLEFDFCIFTNLTRDHLDFHETMEAYGGAKRLLFEGAIQRKSVAVINVDDEFGRFLRADISRQGGFVYAVGHIDAEYLIRKEPQGEIHNWQHSRFVLQGPHGQINIRSKLIGSFNISNLAISASVLDLLGFDRRQIEQGLNNSAPAKGRFEVVENSQGIIVIIDYAHTPDAMANVLKTCKEISANRVLCLFGAGGDRDVGKRPLMLKTALQYADAVLITDDNPRSENPCSIIMDIVRDSELWLPWWIIRDRRTAIGSILELAQSGDVVLICGKGHENYQEIQGEKLYFDDALVAQAYLTAGFGEHAEDKIVLPVDELMLHILAGTSGTAKSEYINPRHYFSISTDSRTLQAGAVFIALTGPNYTGSQFLPEVLANPENFAVADLEIPDQMNYIRVDNPLSFLASLHKKYLLMFPTYKIAITGSTGKSSTKELIGKVLSNSGLVLKTHANENNLIGLCKTISRILPEHRYAIFELGTNAFGEIAHLSDVCTPNAGVILNIGPSHLEFLENEDGVFLEKRALFERPLDLRLFDADDPRFDVYRLSGRGVGYCDQANFRISDLKILPPSSRFTVNEVQYEVPSTQPHYIKNAAFAIALGLCLGMSSDSIRTALLSPVNLSMRMEIKEQNGLTILIDCYNANPVSMRSAIEHWSQMRPDKPHVAILGDMLELGAAAPVYHDMIAAILVDQPDHELITVGESSIRYHTSSDGMVKTHFASVDDLLASQITLSLKSDSVVLVKGSHSIHLEKLIPYLGMKE